MRRRLPLLLRGAAAVVTLTALAAPSPAQSGTAMTLVLVPGPLVVVPGLRPTVTDLRGSGEVPVVTVTRGTAPDGRPSVLVTVA